MFVHLNREPRPVARAGHVSESGFSLMDEIPTRLTRVASQMLRDVYNEFGDLSPIPLNQGNFTGSLQVDVTSDSDKVLVKADVPGMRKEDIDISLSDNNVLTITGERTMEVRQEQESRKAGDKVHFKEIRYGKFSRSIPLTEGCDANGIHAKLEQGVLHVVIPKVRPEPKHVRKISIA